LEKGKNFDYEKGDRAAFLELLQDLEKNRENRPFLDRIYNQFGDYYLNSDSTETAVKYYNKSIKAFKQDKVLQSVNYQTLAEINFDNAEYKNAGAYYDSTLTFLEENSRQWRRVSKKRENLDDVMIASLN
jgi:tetratricopeptide (TPR) repeat protein